MSFRIFVSVLFIAIALCPQSFSCNDLDGEELAPLFAFLKGKYEYVDQSGLFDATPEAIDILSRFPDELLPRLPDGFLWERSPQGLRLKRYVMPLSGLDRNYTLQIVIYGPNAQGEINYLTMINGVNYQGYITPRDPGNLFTDGNTKDGKGRRYPFHKDDFNLFVGGQWQSILQMGHIIPFVDTMPVGLNRVKYQRLSSMVIPPGQIPTAMGRYYSTHDNRAYLPEYKDWNERFRRTLEGRMRKARSSYMQWPYYNTEHYVFETDAFAFGPPNVTKNGTCIPEGVLFASVGQPTDNRIHGVLDINWEGHLPVYAKLEVDELFTGCQDLDRFIPRPAVAHFERGMAATLRYVESFRPQMESVFSHRIGSYTGADKYLHLEGIAASHQFTRPEFALDQAFSFSEELANDPLKTKQSIVRSYEMALFMDRQLESKKPILSDREIRDLEYSYGSECIGFEDPYSQNIDRWRQIVRNQNERQK